ncbi:hypothetical protein C8R44DRAFT_726284 [Mycena epipterygia]|nr:hypothetical protein C8R44DRAFT_726284 [Mycena epipterygia]
MNLGLIRIDRTTFKIDHAFLKEKVCFVCQCLATVRESLRKSQFSIIIPHYSTVRGYSFRPSILQALGEDWEKEHQRTSKIADKTGLTRVFEDASSSSDAGPGYGKVYPATLRELREGTAGVLPVPPATHLGSSLPRISFCSRWILTCLLALRYFLARESFMSLIYIYI